MKQKFLVLLLVLLAFGAFRCFSADPALAGDEYTDTAAVETDQTPHEGEGQVVQEDAPAEKEPPAEDKYTPPEVPEDDVNKVESDYGVREEEQGLKDQNENKTPEGELTTGSDQEKKAVESDQEKKAPAEEPETGSGSQHNQHDGE